MGTDCLPKCFELALFFFFFFPCRDQEWQRNFYNESSCSSRCIKSEKHYLGLLEKFIQLLSHTQNKWTTARSIQRVHQEANSRAGHQNASSAYPYKQFSPHLSIDFVAMSFFWGYDYAFPLKWSSQSGGLGETPWNLEKGEVAAE